MSYFIRYSDWDLKWMTVESWFDFRHGLSYSFQTNPGLPPGSYPVGIGDAFLGGRSGRGVKVTTFLHVGQRLRICGILSPLSS
jgi:hypothetical protein